MDGRMAELAEEHLRLQEMNDRRTGTVSILGAGLVGVELAAEIRHFFPNIPSVKLFDPMPTVLPTMPDAAQKHATRWMQEHAVDLVLGDRFNDQVVAQAERDSPGVVYKCVGVTTNVGFLPAGVLDNKGQVRVNSAMQIVAKDDAILFGGGRIFAIGDCAVVDGANPFPKDIYPAEAMGGIVIANLCQALTIQCMQTTPGVFWELHTIRLVMNLCSLGPNDCIMTMNGWTVMSGRPATFLKESIQYTKMSDSRNEMLGTAIWTVVPHI
jgi:NADH dehydrogenase FAD-containing subunit